MSDISVPPISGGQVFSTKLAAEIVGVSESTIRSWRKRGKFALSHCFKDESGNTLWTETGLAEIRRLAGATDSNADPATLGDAGSATLPDAVGATLGDAHDLLQPLADAVALEVIRQQLPGAVRASIHRLLTSTDPADQERLTSLLHSMGLVIAASAFNEALRHGIAASKQAIAALEAGQ